MEVAAKLSGARISAQKARLVADQIRGKKVGEALNLLAFSSKKAAEIIKKVLESAVANAEHNEGADVDDLKVSTVFVNEGRSLKRIMPRAKGRADRIVKRSCHITVKDLTKQMGVPVHINIEEIRKPELDGKVLYEIEGVTEELAREAFALAAAKLPLATSFVKRTVM
eukprot:gene21269-32727_t